MCFQCASEVAQLQINCVYKECDLSVMSFNYVAVSKFTDVTVGSKMLF